MNMDDYPFPFGTKIWLNHCLCIFLWLPTSQAILIAFENSDFVQVETRKMFSNCMEKRIIVINLCGL
jgi:hypothetical protein